MAIEQLPPDEQQAIADNPGVSYTVKDHVVEFRTAAFPDRVLVMADADWIFDRLRPERPRTRDVPSAIKSQDAVTGVTD